MKIIRMSQHISLICLTMVSYTHSCYFPMEMQGEFMTQWLQSGEITYTSLSILYNSIPGWGECVSKQGSQVILKQSQDCYRCISLVQRSASVQQVHTAHSGECVQTQELALASCPSREQRARREVTEMMLYKTRGFYGEAAVMEEHCPLTGRYSLEERCSSDSIDSIGTGTSSTCPRESRLSLHLSGCSSNRPRSLEFQCLGHWKGEDGHNYLSLLDTQLPQLGESPRPRYRCAIYHNNALTTRLALSNDSTCVHQLQSHEEGAEVFVLKKDSPRRPRSRGQRLPSWVQGKWKEVTVEGAVMTYRDPTTHTTLHLRALAAPVRGRFGVSVETECGEVSGYSCLSLEKRTKGIMEFRVGSIVHSLEEASLLCMKEEDVPWVTRAREDHSEPCPLPGHFTGVIPDSGRGLCATSSTSCTHPDLMVYRVFSCDNSSQVYEERIYQCQGQFIEQGLTYTLTRRLDLPIQECFVGVTQDARSHRVLEAGAHCVRGRNPALEGMVMERRGEQEEHCRKEMEEQQEEVVIRSLQPTSRLRHPLYSQEEEEEEVKEYIRVLDIHIDSSLTEDFGGDLHSGSRIESKSLAVMLIVTLVTVVL